jgi:hypothetical protein
MPYVPTPCARYLARKGREIEWTTLGGGFLPLEDGQAMERPARTLAWIATICVESFAPGPFGVGPCGVRSCGVESCSVEPWGIEPCSVR